MVRRKATDALGSLYGANFCEEEVNLAPSRKARKVSIGDVPAAPAEPDAPRDTPTEKQVDDLHGGP